MRKSLLVSAIVTSQALLMPLAMSSTLHNATASQITDNELVTFLQSHIGVATSEFDRYDAEVWLESMLSRMQPYRLDKKEALTILKTVYREAQASKLEADLVLAVIAVESSFDRFAVSRVGAQGLMQVMPFWKQELGRNDDNLMSIATNIHYGCKILEFYLKKSEGRLEEALARYNGSYGTTRYSAKVLNQWQDRWRSGMHE